MLEAERPVLSPSHSTIHITMKAITKTLVLSTILAVLLVTPVALGQFQADVADTQVA